MISSDEGRDDSLLVSIVISGCLDIPVSSSSSVSVVWPASDSDRLTVTMESVGSGWESTCVRGDRFAASAVVCAESVVSRTIANMQIQGALNMGTSED
jgi:hypothetical protein